LKLPGKGILGVLGGGFIRPPYIVFDFFILPHGHESFHKMHGFFIVIALKLGDIGWIEVS